MRLLSIGLLVAGAAWMTCAWAEEQPEAEVVDLAEVVEGVRAEHDLPAMGAAFLRDGKLVALGVSGVRQRGKKPAVTNDDLWHLGSCTKTMTATLAARIIEREQPKRAPKLTFGLTLEQAFPKLKGLDDGYKPVTLELLLGNRSGAPGRLVGTPIWPELQRRKGSHREQRETLCEWVLTQPPEKEPGTEYIYSNAGFAIAGAVMEERFDTPWEDLLRAEVFEPLGMKSAGFGPPGTKKKIDQPRGHMANGIPVAPGKSADNPAAIGPAGTVHASLADWAKFVAAHLTGPKAEPQEDAFLQPETFRRLQTPLEGQQYALGWVIFERDWGGGSVLMHNGSNTMWYCVTWVAPERGIAVLITCNQGGPVAEKAADQLVGEVFKSQLKK